MLCEPAAAVPCVPYVPWDIAMSRSSRPVAACRAGHGAGRGLQKALITAQARFLVFSVL